MRKKVNRDSADVPTTERTQSLIWERPERPRRERPALNREQIVRVALALADEEGIEAISIRRIAAQLEVSAMALYWYIERKEDLLELMIDAVYGEVPLPQPISADWRYYLQEVIIQTRAMMLRHSWLASTIGHRAVLGPNSLKRTDYLLGIFNQLGFDTATSMSILTMLNAYVAGFVLEEIGEAEVQRRTGLSEHEWQQQAGPYIREHVIASGRYPNLARAIVEGEERPAEEMFSFGLKRLLEGIAADAAPFNPELHR
ncbi:TetR/AcrR family transcriptional regulator [Ktedonosporobacter rubrisoli]|uniref:TetR/AcrR family transcriptional regulator n=1 Tax=Ktedonosporobacter rubrisoli TaxID=2509675 RepID=A0A4P6JNM7_KTERU|nr:TetR/AcrR family transcriptional regulator [Ktedonosporobacter rubrisoli]QBD76672.1 TetR/AcrR family transcriptional regulator [Ktedonosporobacter rubrisoli]